MYFDAPMGYKLFPHDLKITTAQLIAMSKQFDAINSQGSHVWITMHKPADTAIVMEAYQERQYKNISHVCWEKKDHYAEGPSNKMISVWEMGTVGCMPSASDIKGNMSKNPRERPNHTTLPSVLALTKDTSGMEINLTEKPPGLAQWLMTSYCPKGSTVLIVGTGAGGCLKGAVMAGMNVVGVENDERQFHALESELNAWKVNLQKEKKTKQPKTKQQLADAEVSPTKAAKPDAMPELKLDSVAASVEGKCYSCAEPETEDDKFVQCAICAELCHTVACLNDQPVVEGEAESVKGRICGRCVRKLRDEAPPTK